MRESKRGKMRGGGGRERKGWIKRWWESDMERERERRGRERERIEQYKFNNVLGNILYCVAFL